MIQHIKKLFLAMIVLTCFTCFQRADYNLPLFAFSFFLWDYKHPNVIEDPFSYKKSGSSICSSPPGSRTSCGSSTGESPGAQTSINTTAPPALLPSSWPSQSSPSSSKYLQQHSARNHHHPVPLRPRLQNHHQEHHPQPQIDLQPDSWKNLRSWLMIIPIFMLLEL